MILEQNGDCILSSSNLALQHLLCLGRGILQTRRKGGETERDQRMVEEKDGKRKGWEKTPNTSKKS